MIFLKNSFAILLLFFVCACSSDDGGEQIPGTDSDRPNILLIIADDLGKDALEGFSEGDAKPSTPHIDQIRTSGLSFTNFWVNPTCSPTRASIITGKYGYRTGVKFANDALSREEMVLQEWLKEEVSPSYATAIIGKWHLSGEQSDVDPETYGVGHYSGLVRGAVNDYSRWQLFEDGSSSLETGYITEVLADKSIAWLSQQEQPWFLWLAFNAPHTPFHLPPAEMHSQGNLPEYEEGMEAGPYYRAAIEAMDFQIGRVLDALSESERSNTVILFMGDNGSPGQVAQSPYSRIKSKGSLYQGGINVPFFVSGNGVERLGENENALVNSTDLFTTIGQLAGGSVIELHDSQSFLHLLTSDAEHRSFQYAEIDDGTNDQWAISNGNYKLILDANGTVEFYHLTSDPYEEENLMLESLSSDALAAKSDLEAELGRIRN
jgi:arylsulfatase B